MKTAVTVIKTIQTGIDNFKDLKKTKVFDDSSTLIEIKKWVVDNSNAKKMKVQDVSLGSLEFSDFEE